MQMRIQVDPHQRITLAAEPISYMTARSKYSKCSMIQRTQGRRAILYEPRAEL